MFDFEITSPTAYINTPEISIEGALKNNSLLLISIWTFGCNNCVRTLPFLNELYKKYNGKGFEIISIHSPEFSHERNIDNVENFVKENDIRYPVIMDNDLVNFSKNGNRYWPRKYLIDKDRNLIGDWTGEGHYNEILSLVEKLFRKLNCIKKPLSFLYLRV